MGPKMGRKNVRKIEIPTDTPTEFEFGDTVADIQRRREEIEHRNNRWRRGRGRKPGGWKLHSHTQ